MTHPNKSKMAEAAIFNFGKNVNNFGLDKDILKKIIWEDAPRPCGDDHVTKIRNRKLIRVTSSNEVWSINALISVTITDIWTKFDIELKHYTVPNLHDLKIQNVHNSELDRAICIKFGGQMHHGHAEMTHDQQSKPKVYLRDVIEQNVGNICAMMWRPSTRALNYISLF